MPRMFSADDLDAMQQVRDAVDPQRLCNPGKDCRRLASAGKCPVRTVSIRSEQAGLANVSDGCRQPSSCGRVLSSIQSMASSPADC